MHALGLLDDALAQYNVALKLQVYTPRTGTPHWHARGQALMRTLQPSSTLVYFNLGNIYLEKGYMENAQLLLTSMQVLQPPPPSLLLLTPFCRCTCT